MCDTLSPNICIYHYLHSNVPFGAVPSRRVSRRILSHIKIKKWSGRLGIAGMTRHVICVHAVWGCLCLTDHGSAAALPQILKCGFVDSGCLSRARCSATRFFRSVGEVQFPVAKWAVRVCMLWSTHCDTLAIGTRDRVRAIARRCELH